MFYSIVIQFEGLLFGWFFLLLNIVFYSIVIQFEGLLFAGSFHCCLGAPTPGQAIVGGQTSSHNSPAAEKLTHSDVTYKRFVSQNCRSAMFSVLCCCLHPSQVSVCCPF